MPFTMSSWSDVFFILFCLFFLFFCFYFFLFLFFFFFFQAEDGIRDRDVTGVQTCALPISVERVARDPLFHRPGPRAVRDRRRADARKGRARCKRLPGACVRRAARVGRPRDRKSTRLNSSHITTSYAVFCLKKKKNSGPRSR